LKRIHPLVWLIAAGVLANAYSLTVDHNEFFNDRASTNDRVQINRLPQIDGSSGQKGRRTAQPSTTARQIEGRVTHVRDGDTIEVMGTPIRFAKLDCAELGTPAGERAKRRMAQLVAGEKVQCQLSKRRSYDRVIGECDLQNGQSLSGIMIREGICRRWR
jgi:endonuclease YncB( thermonuclease family)